MGRPVRIGELPPGALAEVLDRAAEPVRYQRWAQLMAHAGNCAAPIRLTGWITAVAVMTGEAATVYDTAAEPDRVLLLACRNRRESVCPPCSATYAADTWHLVAAGLRGGKGLPDTVAGHPRLLVTLTAPSFGLVHTRADRHGRIAPCRPRRRPTLCRHGRDLALLAGLTVAERHRRVRVRFAKVAEGQRRGVVHLHAVLRLDAAARDDHTVAPPPAPFTAALLTDSVRAAAAGFALTTPALPDGQPGRVLRWGEQLDVRPVGAMRTVADDSGGGERLDERAAAGYLAKYVTKATAGTGMADRAFTAEQLAALEPGRHLDRLPLTAWRLGGHPELAELRLRRWAHVLGFRGHVATRSRGYSTTLGRLRAARHAHRLRHRHGADGPADAARTPPAGDRGEPTTLLLADWTYAGRGHRTAGEAWLAETAAARAREHPESRRLHRLAFPDPT